ncbi:MAG: 50S ribosomal protein L6 [Cobetia sp.]|jgi:large subunit ribosomal protein L6|uniref:50S ribosomal protein L6 n=1 Tax=Cobetia TaxID=204286 RepID=UPI000C5073CE|nr:MULTISPECIES: 50S ribosomal protein L6 [Cobetia]MBR9756004.1 50S ribosomal protein L6 [Gammaproteobacteria bacterium]MBE2170142.1 50S ribosomal protein L6 [Cobetia sp. 2AS1]MBF08406.1 50S ribosomal protein L6 [Cobetia sp.]MBK08022.1 50S ribosomal protein L6 [Cobetia sp.]MBR9798737.1 50S ribosomal protein L6 [Gammaproteobacteria bacterium]|tara:strand:+ start:4190 stop:4720 length:531 start_codon:yes stop_codon:yes gene_type:complete
MSRVAKYPVKLPNGVEAKLDGDKLTVKGSKGQLELTVHQDVVISMEEGQMTFAPSETAKNWAMVGTTRALVNNMVSGVSEGFTKSLEINGVGYRAQAKGQTINLTLGFSHPVDYELPASVTAETPKNTQIVLTSADKQALGQVAAEIRAFRPPEPYKGKGIRYSDEVVRRKEAKKK